MNMDRSANIVGFLYVGPTQSQDGWVGAYMVTDQRGYPLEFRATTPVRPSTVQKALWGSTLERYVTVELCGRSLIQESSRKPSLVVCPSDQLLQLSSTFGGVLARVRRESEALEPTSGSPGGRAEAYGWAAVVFRMASVHELDVAAVQQQLKALHAAFDLVEVFERIRSALQVLAKEDKRYA